MQRCRLRGEICVFTQNCHLFEPGKSLVEQRSYLELPCLLSTSTHHFYLLSLEKASGHSNATSHEICPYSMIHIGVCIASDTTVASTCYARYLEMRAHNPSGNLEILSFRSIVILGIE